ncbi:MAG: S24 family peptidase [Candidatus Omnitrophota bacterium]
MIILSTMTIKLKFYRDQAGLTQEELSEKSKVKLATIRAIEQGINEPNPETRKKLCKTLNISEAELYGALPVKETTISKTVEIPVRGECPADRFNFAFEDILDTIILNYDFVKNKDCFALRVKGDCLKEAGIFNGDLVIVSPNNHINNGDIIVARIGDECTMKKFYRTKTEDGKSEKIILEPCNHDYAPIVIDPKNTTIEIIGKVIKALKSFN